MFSADALIDTIQTGKKTFVNTFVTNDTVKSTLIDFVDAQAEYTKTVFGVASDMGKSFYDTVLAAVQKQATVAKK